MSDLWIPGTGAGGGTRTRSASVPRVSAEQRHYQELANRVSLLSNTHPWLASQPDVLEAMAMDPTMDPEGIARNAGQLMGMAGADQLRARMESQEPETQRMLWTRLTVTQQQALTQMGYQAPADPDRGGMFDFLGPVGQGVGGIVGAVSTGLRAVGEPALEALTWAGDQPAHLYRTWSQLDDSAQGVGLFGALVGGLGVALAPVTGGLSLGMTAAAIGGGALAGLSVGGAITNPNDWIDAFSSTWDGEKVYSHDAQRKAREILGNDSTLISLASEVAWQGDLYELATEFAGARDATSENTLLASVNRVAATLADPSDPRFTQVADGLSRLVSDPKFRAAVDTLQEGKVSFGRSIARGAGLAPGSGLYRVVSGGLDGIWAVTLDPTLAAGALAKWNKARKYGIPVATEGADMAMWLRNLSDTDDGVRRAHELLAEAIERGDPRYLKRMLPDAQALFTPLSEHRAAMAAAGELGESGFTRADFLNWVDTNAGMHAMLSGQGLVEVGRSKLIAARMTSGKYAWAKTKEIVGATIDFADDNASRAGMRKLVDDVEHGIREADAMPAARLGDNPAAAPFRFDQAASNMAEQYPMLHAAVNAIDRIPVLNRIERGLGSLLGSMTNMIPPSRAVALSGSRAALDIDKFVDLGRVAGLPSDVRNAWAAFITDQANPALRALAAESYLDTLLVHSGIRELPEGVKLADEFLTKYHQAYGLGGVDEMAALADPRTAIIEQMRRTGVMPVKDMAAELVLPDLRELRRAVQKGTVTKYLLNAADARFIDTAMTKVWKPSVLLRIGFIPRAAGEELLAHFARNGVSSMMAEFGERSIAEGRLADPAEYAKWAGVPQEKISEAVLENMERWRYAAHVRPIQRILARYDYLEPWQAKLEAYSTWLRSTLADGLLSEQMTKRIAASKWDKAILGDERGFRHFLLTGSNDEVQEAAQLFIAKHGDLIMREVSATSNPMVDVHDRDSDIVMVDKVVPGTRDITQERMRVSRGRFKIYDNARYDQRHRELIHRVTDEVMAGATLQPMARFLPDGVTPERAQAMAAWWDEIAEKHWPLHRTLQEALDGRDITALELDTLFRDLRNRAPSEMRERIAYLKKVDAMRALVRSDAVPTTALIDAYEQAFKLTPRLRASIDEHLGDLDPATAGWASTFLPHGPRDGRFLSYGEARAEAEAELARLLVDPRYQDAMGFSIRGQLTPSGAVVRNPLPAGQTRVYFPVVRPEHIRQLRAIVDNPAGFRAAWDQLAMGANVGQHADVVDDFLDYLAHDPDVVDDLLVKLRDLDAPLTVPLSFYAMSDPAVARTVGEAITTMLSGAPLTQPGRVAYADVADEIARLRPAATDARGRRIFTDGLDSPYTAPGGAIGWGADPEHLLDRVELVPPAGEFERLDGQWVFGVSAEDAAREWAEVMLKEWERVATTGSRTKLIAREPALDGRRIEAYVGKVKGKEVWEPIAVGDEVTAGRRYRTVDGDGKTRRILPNRRPTERDLQLGDARFLRQESEELAERRLLWEVVGPALRDAGDEMTGTAITGDGARRIFRSKATQFHDVPAAELSDKTIDVVMTPAQEGRWDRLVRRAFDDVIGPTIDAVVRKPMAMHHFIDAYIENKKAFRWLLDTDLIDNQIPRLFERSMGRMAATDAERAQVAELGRRLDGLLDIDPKLLRDTDVIGHLAKLGDDGLRDLQGRAQALARIRHAGAREQLDAVNKLLNMRPARFRMMTDGVDRNRVFVESLLDEIGPKISQRWDKVAKSKWYADLHEANPDLAVALAADNGLGWRRLQAARTNLDYVQSTIGETAALRAINNTVPFLDSHEIRSQFSEYGRNLMPFWYAEENFMKRWARTIRIAPEAIRKGQLMMNGLRSMGVVRTGPDGKDWFVYPGSGALTEVLGRLPGMDVLPVGAMMQAPVQNMLPGFSGRMGAPSPSPLIGIPLEFVTNRFRELEPLQDAIAGGGGLNRGYARMIFPTQVMNVWEAAFGDEDNSQRYASAMMSAAAMMEAKGLGLPDNADAEELDRYLNRLKKHARTVMVVQAITGFVAPGAPSQIVTGDDGVLSAITAAGVDDPSQLLGEEYRLLVQQRGLEEGTAEYIARHPDDDLSDFVSPLAFTVGKTDTPSGALIPATQETLSFVDANEGWLAEFPDAGAWLIPPSQSAIIETSSSAYTELINDKLRARRTPREFLLAMMFKEGSGDYFAMRDAFQADLLAADDDPAAKAQLTAIWQQHSSAYLAQHPLFAEQLQSGDGKARRERIIAELGVALYDPAAPQPWHAAGMRTMYEAWLEYRGEVSSLADDRRASARKKVERAKAEFQSWAELYVLDHPELQPFWQSVLRPESNLS